MILSPLHVIMALAIVVSCQEPVTHDEPAADLAMDQDKQVENIADADESMQKESDILKLEDPLDPKNSELSILPPLILLDFGDDADNSTSGDEKSKRTIDNNLGYGFARNNLFTGKSNYYFPAGKSGTTVSIEESISPFQPKTIIENIKPISEKPYPGDQNSGYGQNPLDRKNFPSGQQSNSQIPVQTPNNQIPANRYPQSVFGQRTKLYKPSQTDYNGYQSFSSTPKSTIASYTTSKPDYRSNAFNLAPGSQNIFVTPRPGFPSSSFVSGYHKDTTRRPFVSYSTSTAPSYVTPTSSSYQTSYTANSVDSFATPSPTFDGSTTIRSSNSDPSSYSSDSPLAAFANLPRYTIENGVRYENKIVWKYSDGKISQRPPASYVNAYNEFLLKQNPGVGPPSATSYQNIGTVKTGSSESYRPSGTGVSYPGYSNQGSFQNLNHPSQSLRYQNPQESRFTAEVIGNINSKSPAQFPNDQESSKPSKPSQFVSSASLQSGNFGIGSKTSQTPTAQRGQSYEFAYQGQYGLKTSLRSGDAPSNSGAISYGAGVSRGNTKLLKDSYGSSYDETERLVPKYEVNSPNPEYTYTTESSLISTTPTSSNLFTPSGTLSPNVLSKYSTQAQNYLTKVFSPAKKNVNDDYQPTSTIAPGQSYGNSYINTNYENLLNYNPSISQYIRNPASILKAQPTYIQAGNSLIPVIILRVDGAPPIQSKTTPNINLKALLQQYLTQYADSIGQNGSNYDDNRRPYEKPRNAQQSPIHDLTQLAQSLSQYSQNPGIVNNFAKQYQENQNYHKTSFQPRTAYDENDKSSRISSNNYGSRMNKPKKIKSVQIIDDPRFTSYKVNR